MPASRLSVMLQLPSEDFPDQATEKKATDAASREGRKLWADEPPDLRYIGEDIDLATLTPEQIPEIRRREEHEDAMAKNREDMARQQQATLEREIAVEEIKRLQKGRLERAPRSALEDPTLRRLDAWRPLCKQCYMSRYC